MGVIGRLTGRRGANDVEGRIRAALSVLRPLLGSHAERVDLLEFAPATGVAVLIVEGGCPDCDMPAAALLQGIGAHLRARVPEVRDVRTADTHQHDHG
jgi:Fe-S cluster biogenesis protein NfuA